MFRNVLTVSGKLPEWNYIFSDIRLIGDCKLSIAVNVRKAVCLSVGVHHLSPYCSWASIQSPHDPELFKWGWMDGWTDDIILSGLFWNKTFRSLGVSLDVVC